MKDNKAYQDNPCVSQNNQPDQPEKDLKIRKTGATKPITIYEVITSML